MNVNTAVYIVPELHTLPADNFDVVPEFKPELTVLDREKMEKYVESLRFDMEFLSPNSRPYRSIAEEIEFVTTTYL